MIIVGFDITLLTLVFSFLSDVPMINTNTQTKKVTPNAANVAPVLQDTVSSDYVPSIMTLFVNLVQEDLILSLLVDGIAVYDAENVRHTS